MIKTVDLIEWAKEHAVGKSLNCPYGFIHGDELLTLANQIIRAEPLVHSPKRIRKNDDTSLT